MNPTSPKKTKTPKKPKVVKKVSSQSKTNRLEEIFTKRVGKDLTPAFEKKIQNPKEITEKKTPKPKVSTEKKTPQKSKRVVFSKNAKLPKRNLKAASKKRASKNFQDGVEVLDFDKPLWVLPGEWWNSPEAISDPREAKKLFPNESFGSVEEVEDFALFDHRELEQHLRPPLERDNFEEFFKLEVEEEERGEEVASKFLAAKKVDISTRRIPPRTFNSAAEFLFYLWEDRPKPKKPIGGCHISRFTKNDFPLRVTAFPRPLFLDYGYPLQFSLFSNLIQLEVQDYVLEVEDLFRRQDAESSFLPITVLQRHQFEASIRQKAAEAVTSESGEGEKMLRHFPLLPLIEAQEAQKYFGPLMANFRSWRVFASEDIVPFKYSNAFVQGTPRPSFSHISKREEKRLLQLCLSDPNTYEPFCEDVNLPNQRSLPKKVEKLFRETIREDFERVYEFSQQLNNQKKYKLTYDELKYFGFSDLNSSALPFLESYNLPKTPLIFEKWKLFVEEEAPVEIDFESENSGAFNKK